MAGDDRDLAAVQLFDPGQIHAAAQQGDQAVPQIAGEQRCAAEQQGQQTVGDEAGEIPVRCQRAAVAGEILGQIVDDPSADDRIICLLYTSRCV